LLQLSGEGNAKKYQHWVNVIHKCRFCLFSTFLWNLLNSQWIYPVPSHLHCMTSTQ
jgi:hypothetical protein